MMLVGVRLERVNIIVGRKRYQRITLRAVSTLAPSLCVCSWMVNEIPVDASELAPVSTKLYPR
jgi:hypothetical protein